MDDLPTPASLTNDPVSQTGNVTIGKELEPAAGSAEQAALKDVGGQEIEIPKEVASAGVKVQPTIVQLPQNITQMGVKPVGQVSLPQTPAVALPLTDDQIVLGLKQSVTSSWRWLAEWCVKKLKQIHRKIVKSS